MTDAGSQAADLGFIHRFVPGLDPDQPPLLLLHGTGGDEHDLMPLANRVAPGRHPAFAARAGQRTGTDSVFPPLA